MLRLWGDDYLEARVASSFGVEGDEVSPTRRSTAIASLERRTRTGWAYRLDGVYQGPDYDPAAGFVRRRDFFGGGAELRHVFRPSDDARVQSWYPRLAWTGYHRNEGGGLQTGVGEAGLYWETLDGGSGNIRLLRLVDDVRTPFSVGGARIDPGEYRETQLSAQLGVPFGRTLRGRFLFGGGGFFGDSRVFVDLQPTWSVSRHLELSGRWNASRLRRSDGTRSLNLVQLRTRLALDAHASVELLAQYSSVAERFDLNVRGRYNFSEGTDLWIVLDGGARTDLDDPNYAEPLPRSTGHALIVKFTRTFSM